MDDLIVENGQAIGIEVSDVSKDSNTNSKLSCDAVVLAVGHSARDVYQMLLRHDVELTPKDFSVSLWDDMGEVFNSAIDTWIFFKLSIINWFMRAQEVLAWSHEVIH